MHSHCLDSKQLSLMTTCDVEAVIPFSSVFKSSGYDAFCGRYLKDWLKVSRRGFVPRLTYWQTWTEDTAWTYISFPEKTSFWFKGEDQPGCSHTQSHVFTLVCTSEVHLSWGMPILHASAPLLGWIWKECGLSLPCSGEDKQQEICGYLWVSLVASQGAAGKGARKAWGHCVWGQLQAQRGWLARAGSSTGNGGGNGFSTGRVAGAGFFLRQMTPVEIKKGYVTDGARIFKSQC